MSTDYEEWYRHQVKVIREEALELRQEKDENHQINITVNSRNEQENGGSE